MHFAIKPHHLFLVVLLGIFGVSSNVFAVLIDRGAGLIYDDVLDITWLQNASLGAGSSYDVAGAGVPPQIGDPPSSSTDGLMTWENATAWADNLVYEGYSDWRLPSLDTRAFEGFDRVNCNVVSEIECRSNEMGYMYIHHLGGEGPLPGGHGIDRSGNPVSVYGIQFFNVQVMNWTSSGAGDTAHAFRFDFGGSGGDVDPDREMGAWAVREGDSTPLHATVSEPAGVVLMALGLVALLVVRPPGRTEKQVNGPKTSSWPATGPLSH